MLEIKFTKGNIEHLIAMRRSTLVESIHLSSEKHNVQEQFHPHQVFQKESSREQNFVT
jgi:hypothetical protein